MDTALADLIDRLEWHQQAVWEVAARLPSDEATLDAWIAATVQAHDAHRFVYLAVATLASERRLDVTHLEHGLILMPDYALFGGIACHMQGDLAPALVAGLQSGSVHPYVRGAALYLGAKWCLDHDEKKSLPALRSAARGFAREKQMAHGLVFLHAFAGLTKDESLYTLLPVSGSEDVKKAATAFGDAFLAACRAPIIDLVPVEAASAHVLAAGNTMRRAVARVGRNEDCPCGSGKKYKRCCATKDQERLHFSTDIAGTTVAELRQNLEAHLTRARLEKTLPHEVARLDPTRVPRELLLPYLDRLIGYSLFEELTAAFEKLGRSGELEEEWDAHLSMLAYMGQRSCVKRMLRLHPEPEAYLADAPPHIRLSLSSGEPARFLEILEESARAVLEMENDDEDMDSIAYGAMTSDWPALGIVIARSLIPIIRQRDASSLFDKILQTRDRLELSPDDAFSDIMDERFARTADASGVDAEEFHLANQKLQEKGREVRELKESLARLRREIERREKKTQNKGPSPAPAPAAADPRTTQELREKVTSLRAALKERHQERADLRRQLEKVQTDLETLRQIAAAPTAASSETAIAAASEDHSEPAHLPGHQPVRLIAFPKKFHETLALLPRATARGVMTMLGRLAAGEPSAFVGLVQLKACTEILRARIGIDYRLLFRLQHDCVQVIDLINRKDLERRIKQLRAAGYARLPTG